MPKKYTSQAFDELFSTKDQDWIADGACREIPTEIFFSEKQSNPNIKTAKIVCNTCCPVRAECLAYALKSPWMSGIFGGTDERERKEILAYRKSA